MPLLLIGIFSFSYFFLVVMWGKSLGNASDTVAPSCRDTLVMGRQEGGLLRLCSALGDHFADGIIECCLVDELLQGDVHTVTPVVLRV